MSLFDQSYIIGEVTRILFQNEENFYTVLKTDVLESNEDFQDEATVTGYLPQIVEGDTYTFKGKVTHHPKYGMQLQVETFEKEMPQSKDGIIQYLSSDIFKGIGKKTAKQIVECLGDDALNIILQDKDVLKQVPKLSDEKIDVVYNGIVENQMIEKIMIKLNEFGFGAQLAMKIYQFYKEETLNVIEQSPFKLVMDIDGIGFSKADELARKIGIDENHPERLKAGLMYSLEQASLQNGHTYIPEQVLLQTTYELLTKHQTINPDLLVQALLELSEDKRVVNHEKNIYIPSLFYSESKAVQILHRLLNHGDKLKTFEKSDVLLTIGAIEEMFNVTYAPLQREALETALNHKIMILTGGPGTGKTTVINGIVNLYAELHGLSLNYDDYDDQFPIALCAPTGRASKRLSESTGLEATTIHRLIGWTRENKPDDVLENEIEAKLIIIDEMSMVDTWLMFQLLRAIPNDAQIIFVGDQDQLPSVGPGQVFKDLIDSKIIPQIELQEVYRQQEGSSIIELAHQIKRNEPFDITKRYNDRSFIPCSNDQVGDVIEKIVKKAVERGYDKRDIQVLAPIYKGTAGIRNLNKILQNILNPKDEKQDDLVFGDVLYRKGDKVLQLVNRPEDGVFNGDIGEITDILKAHEAVSGKETVVVDYDDTIVNYTKQDLMELTHAYCCSIHKSQGSEFPIVIMPIVNQYYRMLQKNILYTGLTRASQSLMFIGDVNAFNNGIKREGNARFTTFYQFLVDYFNVNQTPVEKAMENAQENVKTSLTSNTIKEVKQEIPIGQLTEENMIYIDPMINMNGISPFDFETVDA